MPSGLGTTIEAPDICEAYKSSSTAKGPTSDSDESVPVLTGVIDGAITDVAAAVSRKYYEVQDHFTVVPVLSAYLHGYVNPAWYDSLSDKAKAALDEAGKKASLWAIEASDEAGAAGPEELRAKGVNVHVATPEENAALEAVMRPAFDKAFGEGDPASQKLIELLGKI